MHFSVDKYHNYNYSVKIYSERYTTAGDIVTDKIDTTNE